MKSILTIMLATAVLFCPTAGMCSDSPYQLTVHRGGFLGSDCGKELLARMNDYLIGSVGTIVVHVDYPDSLVLPYQGIHEWTWPQGLTIEANILTDTVVSHLQVSEEVLAGSGGMQPTASWVVSHFQPSERVLSELNLRYFVQRDQAWTDSMWRFQGVSVDNPVDIRPAFWFHHDVAPEWAGKYLCLRVRYESPVYGKLASNVTCYTVSAPCSKADSDGVNIANVVAAGWERDYNRVRVLVDSLYDAGWVNRQALGFAGIWAVIQHRYDDRLHFLDIEFQHYGNVGASNGEDVKPITPESRAQYEEFRQKALKAKAEYEQQQQQQR